MTPEIPSRTHGPLSMEDVVRFQGATGDLNPHHYDAAIAAEAGFDRFFVPGMLLAGYMGSLVVDAYGADCVRRLRARFHELVWVGETVVVTARVEREYQVDGERRADLELECLRSDGTVAVSGFATAAVG
jgi:acyl dehydratase